MTETEVTSPDHRNHRRQTMKMIKIALIGFALILPALPFVIGATDWLNFNSHVLFALIIGCIATIIVGVIFMAITFHSARSGHDDQLNYRAIVEASADDRQQGESDRR